MKTLLTVILTLGFSLGAFAEESPKQRINRCAKEAKQRRGGPDGLCYAVIQTHGHKVAAIISAEAGYMMANVLKSDCTDGNLLGEVENDSIFGIKFRNVKGKLWQKCRGQ